MIGGFFKGVYFMKFVSEVDYFREKPGKAALALVLSIMAGFVVGVAVHLFLVTFLYLEPYLSAGFSFPASVATALYLNRVIRSLIKR